ncbi:unnamed protein product, partial [Amoebophrya sp. A120]|eukprot:GSA120T00022017001.1
MHFRLIKDGKKNGKIDAEIEVDTSTRVEYDRIQQVDQLFRTLEAVEKAAALTRTSSAASTGRTELEPPTKTTTRGCKRSLAAERELVLNYTRQAARSLLLISTLRDDVMSEDVEHEQENYATTSSGTAPKIN